MAILAAPAAAASALPTAASMAQYLPAIISAISSGVGGALSGDQETPMQGKQREVIDQILSSLNGDGPFSHLFNADEDTFQRSYVQPSMQRFNTQIAPQIKEKFFSSGQQGGTGMQDALTRAGVDLNSMLDQQYAQFQQRGQQNQWDAISKILSQPSGGMGPQSGGDKFMQGLGGYLTGESFPKTIEQLLNPKTSSQESDTRTGYTKP